MYIPRTSYINRQVSPEMSTHIHTTYFYCFCLGKYVYPVYVYPGKVHCTTWYAVPFLLYNNVVYLIQTQKIQRKKVTVNVYI